MNVFRLAGLGAAVAALFLSVGSTGATDDIEVRPKQLRDQLVQVRAIGQTGALLTPEAVEKLKLTAEQKEKFDKIETEYKDKQKAANDKRQEAIKSGDRERIKEAFQNARTEGEKLRTEQLGKVEALLTAEQKQILDQVKKEQPQPGIRRIPVAPPVGGQVLPPAAQEKLKLTDEQKKKVAELQKELEARILSVLTDEQKKQYEEMKKQPTQPRPGGGFQLRRAINPGN